MYIQQLALPVTSLQRFHPYSHLRKPLARSASTGQSTACHASLSVISTASHPKVAISFTTPLGLDLSSYPSMEGKTVLITGGAKGIGFNTARLLALFGASVHIADIDTRAATAAVEQINQNIPSASVHATPQLDLGQQASVEALANWVASRNMPLDMLINNAGANFMGVEPWFTSQGVAGLPQVNFLGPYTLTRLLQQQMSASSQPRIVNVASVMHRFSILPEDPDFFLRDWWVGGSYRNCKLALVGFTQILQQRLESAGVAVVAVDPGAVYSNIWATSKILGRPPMSVIIKSLFSTPEDACATSVHAAAADSIQPAGYYARGLFASDAIVQAKLEPWAGMLSCLDWPTRSISNGQLSTDIKAVDIAPNAKNLSPHRALWDACADLAGLPR